MLSKLGELYYALNCVTIKSLVSLLRVSMAWASSIALLNVRFWLCQQSSMYSHVIHPTHQTITKHVFKGFTIVTKQSNFSKLCHKLGYTFFLLSTTSVKLTWSNCYGWFRTVHVVVPQSIFIIRFSRFLQCHKVSYHLIYK